MISMAMGKGDASDEAAAETPPLSPELQEHIGRQLKTVYSELVCEPVPAKFLKLLEQLEAKEKKS